MPDLAPTLLLVGGIAHCAVLTASALVPFKLNWREELRQLPRLHRQMYWTYGAYVVLNIIAFATISILNRNELASGGGLARSVLAYIAVFWAIRVMLQAVFDVQQHLTTWWLKVGYHGLTVLFLFLVLLYSWLALRPL